MYRKLGLYVRKFYNNICFDILKGAISCSMSFEDCRPAGEWEAEEFV